MARLASGATELAADSKHVPGDDALERFEQSRDKFTQVRQPISTTKNHDRDTEGGQILLERDTAIGGEQNLEPPIYGSTKQDTVSQPEPAFRVDRGDFVKRQLPGESSR